MDKSRIICFVLWCGKGKASFLISGVSHLFDLYFDRKLVSWLSIISLSTTASLKSGPNIRKKNYNNLDVSKLLKKIISQYWSLAKATWVKYETLQIFESFLMMLFFIKLPLLQLFYYIIKVFFLIIN